MQCKGMGRSLGLLGIRCWLQIVPSATPCDIDPLESTVLPAIDFLGTNSTNQSLYYNNSMSGKQYY